MDFMAFAMAKPDKAYIFDMPRTESVKQRKGMWSAIEQIKNGYLYDKRYQFRDMWIDPRAFSCSVTSYRTRTTSPGTGGSYTPSAISATGPTSPRWNGPKRRPPNDSPPNKGLKTSNNERGRALRYRVTLMHAL